MLICRCNMKISATRGLRNVDVVIKHLGDKPIDAYTSADAAALRDAMLEKGLSTAAIVIPLSKKYFHLESIKLQHFWSQIPLWRGRCQREEMCLLSK